MIKQFILDLEMKYIKSRLNKREFSIDRMTSKKDVLSVIKMLKPYKTDKDLIRIGGAGDGGYLCPDDFDGIEACFSPGVGPVSTFENECVERGMKVFMADKSVEGPAMKNDKFNFIKKFVGATVNEDFITLDHWVKNTDVSSDQDLMLQMDIEGFEYMVLMNLSEDLMKRFRIILIEFHSFGKLWNHEFYKMASACVEKLNQTHTCVHIHPNTSSGLTEVNGISIPNTGEFSFLRNDRIKSKEAATQFPHPLDDDNYDGDYLPLPKLWYN